MFDYSVSKKADARHREMGKGAVTLDHSVSLVLALLVVFKLSIIPEIAMQALKCGSIAILILFHRKSINDIKHFWVVALLAVVQPVCTLLAAETMANIAYAMVNGLCLIALVLTFKSLSTSYGAFNVLVSFFWMLLIASVANDLSAFISPEHESDTGYLIGNKFTTGYVHMFLLGMYATILSRKTGFVKYNWGLFWVLLIESIIVMRVVDAMTCMVGLVVVAAVSIVLPKTAAARLSTGRVAVAVLIGINIAFFGTGMMLDNAAVQRFITDVLGRSLTLTGRTAIYDELGSVIQMSPFFGWGYGSSVVQDFVGYGNAQNGLMQLLVRYGVIGTAAFLLALLALLPRTKNDDAVKAKGLVGVLYGMFLTSLVETSFGLVFYLVLSLTYAVLGESHQNRKGRSRSPTAAIASQ